MSERTKSALVVLAAAAAAALIYGLVRRPAQQPAQQPSAVASNTVQAPAAPREASRAEIERTIVALKDAVHEPASTTKSPWALAHGLVAFGPELRASNGTKAIDTIAQFAEPQGSGPDVRYGFPKTKNGELVEPHPGLLVKALLEAGVPLEREFEVADGTRRTLARLATDLHRATRIPGADERTWYDVAWTLDALVTRHLDDPDANHAGVSVSELAKAALERLEKDNQVVTSYSGDPAQAFDEGSPLRAAKQGKTGIYGHSCGGLHLVQAVLGTSRLKDGPEPRRLQRQLGVLLFRYEAERQAYASMLLAHPEHGLILRVQQMKFFGHLLETLGLARSLKLYEPGSQGGKRIDRVIRQASADVVEVVRELGEGGVYHRLDAIRSDREQTYLDLVGDGCHAVRGLQRALAVYAD